jgi:hypothetical protein
MSATNEDDAWLDYTDADRARHNALFSQVRGIKPEDQGRLHLELFITEHRLRAERLANKRLVATTDALNTTTKELADAAETSSDKLNRATWVLAGATIGLFIATVALVIVTVAVSHHSEGNAPAGPSSPTTSTVSPSTTLPATPSGNQPAAPSSAEPSATAPERNAPIPGR